MSPAQGLGMPAGAGFGGGMGGGMSMQAGASMQFLPQPVPSQPSPPPQQQGLRCLYCVCARARVYACVYACVCAFNQELNPVPKLQPQTGASNIMAQLETDFFASRPTAHTQFSAPAQQQQQQVHHSMPSVSTLYFDLCLVSTQPAYPDNHKCTQT